MKYSKSITAPILTELFNLAILGVLSIALT